MKRFVKPLMLIALVTHGYFTLVAFREEGWLFAFPPFAQSSTTQIFSDLLIAISFVSVWVFWDLKRRGKALWVFGVYLTGVALSGSFAPLIYFLFRGESKDSGA